MKKIITCFIIAAIGLSCNNKNTSKDKDTKDILATVGDNAAALYEKILGSYVGAFGDNKITLLITKADKDSVSGRSIVGGNDRPFVGSVALANGIYSILAKEPGSDKNDGTFNFSIDSSAVDIVKGSWTPYNELSGSKKEYVLKRKAFEYKPDAGTYQASTKLLKVSDVENLMKNELETMRNEIFARHGYCFKKKETRAYFENEDWYVPATVDIKNKLTEIEKKNIQLIKRYEKYADDYGDDFGR
ncbi:YARHG domain-containing protein [Ferruginibacter sp. SUN106]|uniref:YARHG domain-containing protein n=1 Tax=Ferruginibacter sp. SUN106 TaxID=2978348 RepID=UPI003D368E93